MGLDFEEETGDVSSLMIMKCNYCGNDQESGFGEQVTTFENSHNENPLQALKPVFSQNSSDNLQNLDTQQHEGLFNGNTENLLSFQDADEQLRNDTDQQSHLLSPQFHSIYLEGTGNNEFNLDVKEPSSQSSQKKGKSIPLREEVSCIYKILKEHFLNLPSIFRRDGIRKKQKTHFLTWVKNLLDRKLVKIQNIQL